LTEPADMVMANRAAKVRIEVNMML